MSAPEEILAFGLDEVGFLPEGSRMITVAWWQGGRGGICPPPAEVF